MGLYGALPLRSIPDFACTPLCLDQQCWGSSQGLPRGRQALCYCIYPKSCSWPHVLAKMPSSETGAEGLRDADLQTGGGERFHDPPYIQAELLDTATRSASREHERVRLCGVGLEVAELRLGASALLMSGLRGRQAGGERPGFARDPTSAPRPPGPPRLTRPDCPMLPACPRGSLCLRFRRTPLTSVRETERGRTLRAVGPISGAARLVALPTSCVPARDVIQRRLVPGGEKDCYEDVRPDPFSRNERGLTVI